MSTPDLNLARKPFLNTRPIGRTAVVLWVLGGALLLFNAILYWGYFTSSEDRREELTATEERIDAHQAGITKLRDQLSGLNLPQQNAQVLFLNHKIAERTFGWSRLFDDLEEVMPDQVRLVSLTPQTNPEGEERRSIDQESGDHVLLQIDCIARDGDAQLEFIDRLFASPLFTNPRLNSDAIDAAGSTRFRLEVNYYPDAQGDATPAAPATPAAASPAEDGAAPAAAPDEDEGET